MRKIHDAVKKIVLNEEEALYALTNGFMNLSAYAKQIKKRVEKDTLKDVKTAGIVVSLSRIKKEFSGVHPMIQNIEINNITVKSPLTEIVFEKSSKILDLLSSMYKKIKTRNDDFLTLTLSTNDITVICSDRIKQKVLQHFKEKPKAQFIGLASIGLTIDKKYYPMPNITYSLLRKIAQKKIALAETITTNTEIIFVFNQKHLASVVELFSPSEIGSRRSDLG